MIRVQKVRLYPNQTMKKVLDDLCDYRRYCWNKGLALWNDMYDASLILNDKKLIPSERKVRDELVANKEDWQYQLSARCLQLTISDLSKSWSNFFNKAMSDWGKPKFKSKKDARQGFKTDRAKIVNGKLRIDRPHGTKDWYDIKFKGAKSLDGDLKVISIYRENGKYWASLPFEVEIDKKGKTGKNTAVDVNVGHFDYTDGQINTLPGHLNKLYERIKFHQRQLARKRVVNGKNANRSNNYVKTRAKLQRDYRKVANIQHDIIHKFTTKLVSDYDKIVIEDLDVKKMQMTHIASKGLQRSLFGLFRQVLTYKVNWYGKELIIADRYYPSTQRCSNCGNVKTGEEKVGLDGNKKHGTKHNEYICYECGAIMDRDENAVKNLLVLAY
ncbi:RNA-guided endonuclease InsQ/TnpB family protein [Enterococcus cecorum]|uniref:RNA-guided endonuclease InsQ/TnpB family protein n=1 Tax=Enterococcus cecorum TaxID=44008 RepID=UPI00200B9E53|nr:transposase [Enterococcus cecorum]